MFSSTLVWGVIWCIVAIIVYPMAKRRIDKGEVNQYTTKAVILSVALFIIGIIMIVKELVKVI
jgi:uncharacterized membrane protein YidH (DUF202 family)